MLHATDLDVWVAYDGGVIIVRPGSSGHDGDTDAMAGSQNTPVNGPSLVETGSVSIRLVFSPQAPTYHRILILALGRCTHCHHRDIHSRQVSNW